MKTRLLLILLLSHLISYGQSFEMFVDSTKLWSTLWWSGFPPPYWECTSYTWFHGDIVIGPYHYMEVYDETMCGYIREDSTNKVFYRYCPESDTLERLLYDFGAEAGDTLEIFPPAIYPDSLTFIVESIDSVWVCNRFMKIIQLTGDSGDTWIEGIGSIVYGVMMPGVFFVGVSNSFYCYIQNDTIKYSSSFTSPCEPCPTDTLCCYIPMGINEAEPENPHVTVIPNPVTSTSVLTIGGAAGKDFLIEIYSLTGEKIRTAAVKNRRLLINRTDFTPGLYIYRLYTREKPVISGKFVVE